MANSENSTVLSSASSLSSVDIPENVYRVALSIFVSFGIVVNTLGITGNVLIIIVYNRMGFSESTNISLVALAIADIGSILPTFFGCFVNLLSLHSRVPITTEVLALTSTWPHIAFTRVMTFITCFISLERCLCVMLPLKIRSIITHKRTVFILVLIFLVNAPPVCFVYFRRNLGWKFFPSQNRTLLGTVVIKDTPMMTAIDKNGLFYYCAFLPTTTCTFVTICTIFLIVNLRRNKKWRDSVSSSGAASSGKTKQDVKSGAPSSISREERTVRIVIAVAVTFVASMLLHIATILTSHILGGWNNAGAYKMAYAVVWSISDLIENINSSINLIIYYKMSSKFKEHFLILFNKQKN